MGKRTDQQQARRCRELAARPLNRDDFLELMRGQLAKGANGSFRVRPSCVDASPANAEARRLLFRDELRAIDCWMDDARLDFPCSPEELVVWVDRVKEDFRLPEDFLEAVAENPTTRRGAKAVKRLRKTLRKEKSLAAQEAAMEAEPYDGVRGLPPFWDWLPEHVREQFRTFRDRLLSWDIAPEEAVSNVKATAEDGVTSFPALTYKGESVDVSLSEEAVAFLSNLWLCRDLPPDKALEQLGLEDAAIGYKRRQQQRKFVSSTNQERHETRQAEWESWREEAERLKRISPVLAEWGYKQTLARKVKKNLDLPESLETIRKRL